MMKQFDRRPNMNWAPSAFLLSLAISLNVFVDTTAEAQEAESSKPAKLFSSEDSFDVTITAPWRDLQKDEKFQGAYPAQLTYTDESGTPVTLDITVERRGIKRQEACTFPPIRLRFDKEQVKGTMFRGQDALKMVTHCERSSKYDQYYVLEMLSYRMYNLITDYSFRVRPMQATYVDSDKDKTSDVRFAFLIEDDSDVAKRNGMKKIKVPQISPRKLDPVVNSEVALFQYMIGNVDWASLRGHDPEECCHNVKLIGPDPLGEDDLVIAVPYDFDSAGLVDAEYAAPPEGLRLKEVTQRLYRGYCMNNDTLEAAKQKFLTNESAIMSLIETEDMLDDRTKRKAGKFLEEFFERLKDPGDYEKYIIEKCRG